MKTVKAVVILLLSFSATAQDSIYTRKVISFLCSKKCFGRGYTKNGLQNAENFLTGELKKAGIRPFLSSGFTQEFSHPVNTFPGSCRVILNGRKLKPGLDFILDPASNGAKGAFTLAQKDSVTFVGQNDGAQVIVEIKKKLTFSVAGAVAGPAIIELNGTRVIETPQKIRLKVTNRHVPAFASRNIIGAVDGTVSNDTMLVFTAHYDHLGGMGKKTWFPGANDNASGVSMVLNLANYFLKHPPRYRTLFIFFAAEEAGLIGSEYLVKSGIIELGKIKFLINLDLLGTGDDGIMVVNGAIHEPHFLRLVALNDQHRLVKDIRKRGKARNSDHYHFAEAGVPSFFIYTLGGTTAYHDVQDVAQSLPLTDYHDVFRLIVEFAQSLR